MSTPMLLRKKQGSELDPDNLKPVLLKPPWWKPPNKTQRMPGVSGKLAQP